MINFDNYTNENKTKHISKWPYIPNSQPDTDKIYLYAKDLYETKYQYLINKREKVGLDHFKDPRAFIEYSNDMQHVYNPIENYNPNKKRNILIIFDDMIADMINNKKLNRNFS